MSAFVACAAAALAFVARPRPATLPPGLDAAAARYDVRILRDSWGVPHVFGKDDPAVAFGLAWAHAEDDFDTIQGALLAARGRLASWAGPAGAANDYLVALLRVADSVEQGYPRDLAPEVRALCEGYAAGINLYAARHPGRALEGLFPVRGQDVVAGFVYKLPLFFGIDRVLRALFDPTAGPDGTTARVERASRLAVLGWPAELPGSNLLAVAPRRSADGFTRLVVNSHQPWEGPVAWYEAHLRSDTGWEMAGGLFPGTPLVLHGHNRDLGWAHTVNRPDLIDVYRLELDPANPDRYRFDRGWRELDRRTARIEVKLLGPLRVFVEREVSWSVHGPVVRRPHGVYAIRWAGIGDVRAVEQWYRMGRARGFDEWMAAMRIQGVPMFNTGYADRTGRIAYLYNARLPRRARGYDWTEPVRGDLARTLWTEYEPFERLPFVADPAAGFLQNANSSPYQVTLGDSNPRPDDDSAALGIDARMTNRALRALELFSANQPVSRDALVAFKFDVGYSEGSALAGQLRRLLAAPAPADALLREALALLRRWDLRADPDNRATALALLALRPDERGDLPPGDAPALQRRLRDAARELLWSFGRIDPAWSDVLRLRRGPLDLGLDGAPDVLRAVYGRRDPDGRLRATAGDSYLLMVEWDDHGRVSSRSVHNYGAATRSPRSPHYADQAPLFARHALKPVWLDEAEIRAHLEREYRPGDDR